MNNTVTFEFPTEEQADAFRKQVLEMEGDMLVGFGWFVQTGETEENTFVPRLTAPGHIQFLSYVEETDSIIA